MVIAMTHARSHIYATERANTIIIGGGVSGIACLRRVTQAGIDAVLLTDRLGGRLHHYRDRGGTLSPIYINDDHENMLRFVDRGPRMRLEDTYVLEEAGALRPFVSAGLVQQAPALEALETFLRELRSELRGFRRRAARTDQKEMIESYPLMNKLANMSSEDFVRENKLGGLYSLVRRVSWGTGFTEPEKVNALFLLGSLLPLVTPTYAANFVGTYERLTRGVEERIKIERVLRVSTRGQLSAETESARYCADNLVLALPHHNVRRLIDLPPPHVQASCNVAYVRGRLRHEPSARIPRFVGIGDDHLVWRYSELGDVAISTSTSQAYLASIYSSYEVLDSVTWKTALAISGPTKDWIPTRIDKGVYLIGNHNLPTMEDCFLTGLFAANCIIAAATARQTSETVGFADQLGGGANLAG